MTFPGPLSLPEPLCEQFPRHQVLSYRPWGWEYGSPEAIEFTLAFLYPFRLLPIGFPVGPVDGSWAWAGWAFYDLLTTATQYYY